VSHFRLVGRDVVPEPDTLTWVRWLARSERSRHVAFTALFPYLTVSTLFLGRDRQTLFETVVLGPRICYGQWFWQTYLEAVWGHTQVAHRVLASCGGLTGGRLVGRPGEVNRRPSGGGC
jgi:membrane glycosyltransferase